MAADDPFSLLGLPARFDLEPEQLQRAYLRRSAALHPDRAASPLDQAETARTAARINDARATLADDEQRANALLALRGGATREQDNALPSGFLMEIMEVRQEMEEALQTGDAAERRRFEQWASEKRAEHMCTVRDLFAAHEARGDPESLSEIRRQLNAWRYIERMIEQLDPDYRSAAASGL